MWFAARSPGERMLMREYDEHPAATPEIAAQITAASRVCEAGGGRLTELRALVLRLILETATPLTAYQILDRLKERRGNAVPPTVYRALEFLLAHGLVHRIERLGAFMPCHAAAGHTGHDHQAVQFLICRRCGTVAEIEDHAVSDALARAAEKAGFRANVATVELDGTCAACR